MDPHSRSPIATHDRLDGAALGELTRWAAQRGLYTPTLHTLDGRPPARVTLSLVSDADLSDLFAAWTSEAHRLLEQEAAVAARRGELVLAVKRVHARAAQRARAAGGKPTAAMVADACTLDPDVMRAEDSLTHLESVAAFITRQKQAADLHLTLLSREITQRVSLKNARIL